MNLFLTTVAAQSRTRRRPGDGPPVFQTPPSVSGPMQVGEAIAATPGVWAGAPTPDVRTDLLVGGSVVGQPYTLAAADDGVEVAARDIAVNVFGQATAISEALRVTRRAPTVIGSISDVLAAESDAPVTRDATAAFAGAEGGAWSLLVTDAALADALDIDAAGRILIQAFAPVEDAVVTVRYENSGGGASTSFRVTVAPATVDSIAAPSVFGALRDRTMAWGEPVSFSVAGVFTGADLRFTAAGLSDGLALDPRSGVISGTASDGRTRSVAVTATNGAGAATASFSLAFDHVQGAAEGDVDTTIVAAPDGSVRAQLSGADNPRAQWRSTPLVAGGVYAARVAIRDASGPETKFLRVTRQTGLDGTITQLRLDNRQGGDFEGQFTAPSSAAVWLGGVMVSTTTGAWFEIDRPILTRIS